MRRRAVALAAAAAAGLVTIGCSGDGGAAVDLEGSPQCARDGDELRPGVEPRRPDDEGVVTEISHERITLDGERSYGVRGDLLSFSTYDLELEPMLSRKGQYVHVGTRDGKVAWMAGLAGVVELDDGRAVFYTGHLAQVDDGAAVFCDGTTIRMADGLRPEPGFVQVRIDPDRRAAVDILS